MKRILVTGGTGFIGSAVVRRLLALGHSVRVFDDDSRGASSRLAKAPRLELAAGDVCDAAAVRNAAHECTMVLHLAAVNGTEFFYSKPDRVLEVAVKGMMNVIDACIANKVPELLCASSSEVYQLPPEIPTDESAPLVIPDPLNPRYSYAGGKIISELLTLNYGRRHFERAIIFRPHNVYGPDMGWEHVIPQLAVRMARLAEDENGPLHVPIQGTGTETRAFLHIDDFVDGLMQIVDRGRHLEIYHVGTDEEVAIGDLVKAIAVHLGREAHVIPGALQAGSTPRRCPDIRKLKALGFAPRISLPEGLRDAVAWYAANRHRAP